MPMMHRLGPLSETELQRDRPGLEAVGVHRRPLGVAGVVAELAEDEFAPTAGSCAAKSRGPDVFLMIRVGDTDSHMVTLLVN